MEQINGTRELAKRDAHGAGRVVYVNATVTIQRSPAEVYRFWRDLSNLPRFMLRIVSVTESEGRTVWRARGPFGHELSWDADIVSDRPGEVISWRSTEGAAIDNVGRVEFRPAPGARGTEVHLQLGFEPPLGAAGAGIAKLFEELPQQQLTADLRRLKQILETGEIVCSDSSVHRGRHPARPSGEQAKKL